MALLSFAFWVFAAATAAVYFALPMRARPYALAAAGLLFYGSFGTGAFLFLGFGVCSTFLAGILTERAEKPAIRKTVLGVTVLCNLAVLAVVRYGNAVLPPSGFRIPAVLGISYYTLQAIGYCTDVYRKTVRAERNFFRYLLFMTYFPIIMQGPICRYGQTAECLFTPHRFSHAGFRTGCERILRGLFKKMVIADRAAMFADPVFRQPGSFGGITAGIAILLFSVQIYADFSGCVDICRGISAIFGIELPENFRRPYGATSVREFWRRWHISLSGWLRDYVYIPLGGSRRGEWRRCRNLFAVFLVSGLWHGEGLHFLAWGFLHGVYQVAGGLTRKRRDTLYARLHLPVDTPAFRFGQRTVTFLLVAAAWVFFRAASLTDAFCLFASLARPGFEVLTDGSLFAIGLDRADFAVLLASAAVWGIGDLLTKRRPFAAWHTPVRYAVYLAGILTVAVFGIYGPGYDASQFLYMRF